MQDVNWVTYLLGCIFGGGGINGILPYVSQINGGLIMFFLKFENKNFLN